MRFDATRAYPVASTPIVSTENGLMHHSSMKTDRANKTSSTQSKSANQA